MEGGKYGKSVNNNCRSTTHEELFDADLAFGESVLASPSKNTQQPSLSSLITPNLDSKFNQFSFIVEADLSQDSLSVESADDDIVIRVSVKYPQHV